MFGLTVKKARAATMGTLLGLTLVAPQVGLAAPSQVQAQDDPAFDPETLPQRLDIGDEAPGGIGETGTTAGPPALRNAIFAATGIPLRPLPIASSPPPPRPICGTTATEISPGTGTGPLRSGAAAGTTRSCRSRFPSRPRAAKSPKSTRRSKAIRRSSTANRLKVAGCSKFVSAIRAKKTIFSRPTVTSGW